MSEAKVAGRKGGTASRRDTEVPPDQKTEQVVPPDEGERHLWFAAFGHKGGLNDVIALRDITIDGATVSLGTALVADIWAVWKGLLALHDQFGNHFQRLCNWARANRRPMDPANRLCLAEFGPITDNLKGEWLPGRREIVLALIEPDPDDEDGLTYLFYRAPFGAPTEVPSAA